MEKEMERKDESQASVFWQTVSMQTSWESCLAKLVRKLFGVLTFVNIFMLFR